MSENIYMGVDIGSVSANFVAMNDKDEILEKIYIRTKGRPIDAICEGLLKLRGNLGSKFNIGGVGATGSGRKLVDIVAGADLVKNEITSHLFASKKLIPNVRTIIEIGGQDSKIIFIDGTGSFNFAMNTVCAAGTGAFLDRIAERVGMSIMELGKISTRNAFPLNIAGRCAVFAETDMIHKLQAGHSIPDIYSGLCRALVRNYINNLANGVKIQGPVVFQGGVAANNGIKEAFEVELGEELIVPEYFDVMGAYGAALLSKQNRHSGKMAKSSFKGFEKIDKKFEIKSFECNGCGNHCELSKISAFGEDEIVTGGKCEKWG